MGLPDQRAMAGMALARRSQYSKLVTPLELLFRTGCRLWYGQDTIGYHSR